MRFFRPFIDIRANYFVDCVLYCQILAQWYMLAAPPMLTSFLSYDPNFWSKIGWLLVGNFGEHSTTKSEPQKSRYSLKCSSLTQMPLMSNSHSVCRFVLRLHKLRNSSLYNPPKKEQSVSIPLPQMGDLEYFVEFRVKYMLAVFLAKIYLHCSSTCLLFSPIVSPCWWLPLRTLCDRVHFILESCV